MAPPAPLQPGSTEPGSEMQVSTASSFVRTFSFHVLAVLLGIALAFM